MSGFSAFRLLREALRGQSGWEPQWRAPAQPQAEYDVVIVGGGGHGLATAYYLAKEHRVGRIAVQLVPHHSAVLADAIVSADRSERTHQRARQHR